MTDVRNFLFNTEFPIEQIVYLKSGSFISRAGQIEPSCRFRHDLDFTPLLSGSWSFDPNFTKSYGFFSSPYKTLEDIKLSLDATSSEVIIYDFNEVGDRTIYYRIYGFTPESFLGPQKGTASEADSSFVLNTNDNYCKLFLAGSVAVGGQRIVVPHNLGFIPQADIWLSIGSGSVGKREVGNGLVWLDENNLYFDPDPDQFFQNWNYFYRIYADE